MSESLTENEMLAVYREKGDALYGWVSRRCGGDRALAEDITQETWLRAVQAWRNQGLPERPLAWLRTVARNVLLNRLRQKQPVALDAVPQAELLRVGPLSSVTEAPEVASAVNTALAGLPRSKARLLELFYFDGLSVVEVARRLGISERAVEGRLRRARHALRKALESFAELRGETT